MIYLVVDNSSREVLAAFHVSNERRYIAELGHGTSKNWLKHPANHNCCTMSTSEYEREYGVEWWK